MPEDLYVEITFPIDSAENTTLRTNANRAGVEEILENFIRSQMGRGADSRQAEIRDIYHIRIGLNLDGDVFAVSDDTGNCGLRDGIIYDVFHRFKDLTITAV